MLPKAQHQQIARINRRPEAGYSPTSPFYRSWRNIVPVHDSRFSRQDHHIDGTDGGGDGLGQHQLALFILEGDETGNADG
ncbi:MAG: hypothetical protein KDE34_29590 [Anaerolineales bacterium]|nr:hypothetical protein [Anaerolineales bacterium]